MPNPITQLGPFFPDARYQSLFHCQASSLGPGHLVDAAWSEVLQHLRPRDIPSARRVCKAWHADISRCLHHLHLASPASAATLTTLSNTFPRLPSLHIACCTSPPPSKHTQHPKTNAATSHQSSTHGPPVLKLPHLLSLSLEGYTGVGLPAAAPAPAPAAPAAAAPGAGSVPSDPGPWGADALQLVQCCHKTLTRLELRSCVLLGDLGAVQDCLHLTSLRLLGCRVLGPGTLAPLAPLSRLTRLQSLELRLTPGTGLGTTGWALPGSGPGFGAGGAGSSLSLGSGAALHWAAVGGAAALVASGGVQLGGLGGLTSLRSLALDLAPQDLDTLMGELPQLHSLDLHTPGTEPSFLLSLDTLLPHLIRCTPDLRQLAVKGHSQLLDRHLLLLASLPHLQSVSLSLPPASLDEDDWWGGAPAPAPAPLPPAALAPLHPPFTITSSGMSRLSKGLRLHSLGLGRCAMSREAARVMGRMPGLRQLDVAGVAAVDDSFLFHLSCLRTLQHLNLGGCIGISNIGLDHLVKCAPSLQLLDISGCTPYVTDLGLCRLRELSSLRHLRLSCMEQISDDGVAGLVQRPGGSRLQSLDLGCCSYISSQALLSLAAHAPHLQRLNIDCCARVAPAAVAALLAACPGLQELSAQHCQAEVQGLACALPYFGAGVQRQRAQQQASSLNTWWMINH